jgi:hypothetical protein
MDDDLRMVISDYCEASDDARHSLVVTRWPFLQCKHCAKEYVLFTREMTEHFFEIEIFAERLDS